MEENKNKKKTTKPNETVAEKVKILPNQPGVYIMKNVDGSIIYIGKAKNLKKRVSQYFYATANRPQNVRSMVKNVEDFEYIIAGSEYEALTIENNLIKQHKPQFNIALKNDYAYPFIKVNMKEDYPKIQMVRKVVSDGSRYIGPFGSAGAVMSTLVTARKIFMLPSCEKSFPRDIGKQRPCINSQLKRCVAPCSGKMTSEDFKAVVENAVHYLDGNIDEIIEILRTKMENASENLEFEIAAHYRNNMFQLQQLKETRKRVLSNVTLEIDLFGIWGTAETINIQVMKIRAGRMLNRESFMLEAGIGTYESSLTNFIMQYYSEVNIPPEMVVTSNPIEDLKLVKRFLTKLSGHSVDIRVPQRAELYELAMLAQKNAREALEQRAALAGRHSVVLDDLKRLLLLSEPPRRIEAYDISNLAGTATVGAQTVFEEGKPKRAQYRMYSIKMVEGQDDYAAMSEMISRRMEHLREGDEAFGKKPDLILIDGGQGHVSKVLPVIREVTETPVYGMVKDSKHKTKALITAGGDVIDIIKERSVYTLISTIQEETHRFAIEYHKKTRKKNSLTSELTEIEGIGDTRAKKLLMHFSGMTNIKKASLEELAQAPGMNKKAAESVYNKFHSNS